MSQKSQNPDQNRMFFKMEQGESLFWEFQRKALKTWHDYNLRKFNSTLPKREMNEEGKKLLSEIKIEIVD